MIRGPIKAHGHAPCGSRHDPREESNAANWIAADGAARKSDGANPRYNRGTPSARTSVVKHNQHSRDAGAWGCWRHRLMVSFGNVATPATKPPQPPYTADRPTARPRDSGS